MLKKILILAIFAAVTGGCGKTIQVIETDNTMTNTVPVKAFQDETYIWESWTYSTNRVNSSALTK